MKQTNTMSAAIAEKGAFQERRGKAQQARFPVGKP